MNEVTRKVCLLGDFGVGKTSLVQRYVAQAFSEKYLTTVGVKIDSKRIAIDNNRPIKLVIWDLAGSGSLDSVKGTYLRGSAGFILVADGTRASTVEAARALKDEAIRILGKVPFVCFVNKSDLHGLWEVGEEPFADIGGEPVATLMTSAKLGTNVETGFEKIARALWFDVHNSR